MARINSGEIFSELAGTKRYYDSLERYGRLWETLGSNDLQAIRARQEFETARHGLQKRAVIWSSLGAFSALGLGLLLRR